MSGNFINININDWDNSKVTIEEKGTGLNLLYDGKVPITKYIGTTARNAYLLTCKDGLKKTTTFDTANRKYTKDWDGAWNMSFKVTDNLSKITPPKEGEEDRRTDDQKLRWKIVERREHIKKLVEDLTEEKVSAAMSYKGVFQQSKLGKKKRIGDDPTGYVFLPVKVSYKAPEDAPTQKDNRGKDVPVFSSRKPKGKYLDMARAKIDREVKDPETECAIPMKCIPRTTIALNKGPDAWSVAEYLFEVQYEQDDSLARGGSDMDDTEALLASGDRDLEEQIGDL